tara:strand:+ start:288 stop:575 length:288 start_codon:yes stop_codon:yes gene_type:complete
VAEECNVKRRFSWSAVGERERAGERKVAGAAAAWRERERVRERGTCELTLTMLVIFWRLTGLVRFGHQASLANLKVGEAPLIGEKGDFRNEYPRL